MADQILDNLGRCSRQRKIRAVHSAQVMKMQVFNPGLREHCAPSCIQPIYRIPVQPPENKVANRLDPLPLANPVLVILPVFQGSPSSWH